MDSALLDVERLLADLKALRERYLRLSGMPFAAPDTVIGEFASDIAGVLGVNMLTDGLLSSVVDPHGSREASGKDLLSMLVVGLESEGSAARWLFRMVYAPYERVLDAMEAPNRPVESGAVPLPDNEIAMRDLSVAMGYMREMNRMIAQILLCYGLNPEMNAGLAYNLLVGDSATVLNMLVPMADVRFDADEARKRFDELNDERIRRWMEDVRSGRCAPVVHKEVGDE